jgi:hypothetical protein
MVSVALCIYGPLILLGLVLSCAAALQVLRRRDSSHKLLFLVQIVVWVLWAAGCLFALVDWTDERDWVHLFWSAQIPLVGLFLCSGVLLCRTWRDDAEAIGGARPRARSGASLFLLMTLTLGLAPLVLEIVLPEAPPTGRNIGAPLRRLAGLAAWGCGGPLPECLASGAGHLPREVTVPMGTTLIAARMWIAFCVLALAGRLMRVQRVRIALCLVAPALVAPLWERFDPGFFDPGTDSGIWTSEPALMRSYGPTLLVALVAALVLGACCGLSRRESAGGTADVGSKAPS